MSGATPKQTFRQWKVKTLEIEDGETRRITKKILHDEYMKPYPFETPKRMENFMVIEMEVKAANTDDANVSEPTARPTQVFNSVTTQPTQIPPPPLYQMTTTKPATDETIKNSDVSFEYVSAEDSIEKHFEDFEDPEIV